MGDTATNLAWTTFGRYALLEKIGSGGMAEIYRAKTFGAAGFEKEFAVKLILPSLVDDKEFVEMFINEAKIAVSLYHANIVQVFDLGEIDTQYYIAMEFVHGMDLLDILARCANLDLKIPLDLVLFITMEMLKGLDFAHRAKDAYGEDLNIIHRDVSPSNVMISYAGDVKIGDFGVAKAAIQRNLTETGTLKGKVGYMSPEQVVGDQIDWRSDIFAAGVVFFEALSMSRLFVGNSDLDVMLRVRDADIDDSLDKSGPLPLQIEQIVRRALSKHREERFQTAGEFYQALVDFCYQHRVKVNGADLSNFMRRLFAEEIEAEKNRRLSDLDGKKAQVAELAAKAKDADSSSENNIRVSLGDTPSSADRDRFRYRDAAGLVYGPVSLPTLLQLLRDRTREAGERISVEGAEWVPVRDVEEIAEGLGLSRPPQDTSREDIAAHVESLKAAASALEEISLASSSSSTYNAPLSESTSEPTDAPKPADSGFDLSEQSDRAAIEALRDQYAAYEGTLAKASIARLLGRLHRTKATGRLYLKHDDVEKSIFFEAGEPILADSNREEELLGSFLLSKDVITQEQLEEGLARLSEWGGRLGDALVATGAIPAHEIFEHLSDQMQEKILEVFTWPQGRWGYFENQQPETHGYPLGLNAIETIVSGCFERIPSKMVTANYEGRRSVPIHRRANSPFSMDDLRLSGKALRVLKPFQNGDSLDELLNKLPNENEDFVLRVLYLTHQLELMSFEDTVTARLPG